MIRLLQLQLANTWLYKLIKRLYHYWLPPETEITELLDQFDSQNEQVVFVQIGSNDGRSGDPIYKYIKKDSQKWRGLLIEPVPYLYEKLKSNYEDAMNRVVFENVAIDHVSGSRMFYRLKEITGTDQTPWHEQIGSFSLETIKKHQLHVADFEKRLIMEEVRTTPLSNLLDKHNLQDINLLHIDTEGYDFEIIKMIDWTRIRPTLLLFEHKHLTKKDYKSCCKKLRKYDYKLFQKDGDTIGLYKKVRENH